MAKDNKSKNNLPTTQPDEKSVLLRGEIATATFHSGPLPDPDTLGRYDMVIPGAADRIIKIAENQAIHRQK